MDITFNPKISQLSPIRTARFAVPEEEAASADRPQDKAEISQEGRQASGGITLNGMTTEDFMVQVQKQLDEQQLEVNWNASVDPDGQIWCKAYFDSYVSQVTQFRDSAESAIKNYYADACQEALHSPLGSSLPQQLNFIAAKYQCSWSDYFDASMLAGERQWTYTQLKAMLTGTGFRLDDPYALKDLHIPNVEETTKIAKQTADDKISALVRQAKEANGITE